MQPLVTTSPHVQPIQKKLYQHRQLSVSVLRLDAVHPVVSGNKWFKLKFFLEQAALQHKHSIITFGGAFSNHILATAAAAASVGLRSAGIIRGEAPPKLSATLTDAAALGMELFFISREEYRAKKIPASLYEKFPENDSYLVPEGGYGTWGVAGAREILPATQQQWYTHIVTAVGTGTTLAGLSLAAEGQCLGIVVMKNESGLQAAVQGLLPQGKKNFRLLHDFHFGGYAKKTGELISFMNSWYQETGIPSDFIYTAKMFFAAEQLIGSGYFAAGSNILLVHTGGLQGNRSLPKGTLIF